MNYAEGTYATVRKQYNLLYEFDKTYIYVSGIIKFSGKRAACFGWISKKAERLKLIKHSEGRVHRIIHTGIAIRNACDSARKNNTSPKKD